MIFVAIGAFFQTRSPRAQQVEKPPILVRTDFMSGLNRPWDIAFTPDGAMLFTEKCRGLSVRRVNAQNWRGLRTERTGAW